MRKSIRHILPIIISLFFLQSIINAENLNIGKIVKKNGYIMKTNINCETDNCNQDNILIHPGDRILTGKKSEVYILLNDGTALEILEKSDIIIFSIVDKKNKNTDKYIFRLW